MTFPSFWQCHGKIANKQMVTHFAALIIGQIGQTMEHTMNLSLFHTVPCTCTVDFTLK